MCNVPCTVRKLQFHLVHRSNTRTFTDNVNFYRTRSYIILYVYTIIFEYVNLFGSGCFNTCLTGMAIGFKLIFGKYTQRFESIEIGFVCRRWRLPLVFFLSMRPVCVPQSYRFSTHDTLYFTFFVVVVIVVTCNCRFDFVKFVNLIVCTIRNVSTRI